MTPKVRATWLVVKYMSKVADVEPAKECAIIAVNEIIANIEPSVSMDVISERINYWEQVKEEINKL
jgi:hypothetical protein